MMSNEILTDKELVQLSEDCKVKPVPQSSFRKLRDRTRKEYLSILNEFADLIYRQGRKYLAVSRIKDGLDMAQLQDALEDLGETFIKDRSWSKVEVRVLNDIIVVTNTPRAKGCSLILHNSNILFNIERQLEDDYLKEKRDGQK